MNKSGAHILVVDDEIFLLLVTLGRNHWNERGTDFAG